MIGITDNSNYMQINVHQLCRGRALYISRNGTIYVSQKYHVYRSADRGKSWCLDSFAPHGGLKSLAANVPLASRVLRYYFAAFQVLDDGSRVAVARDGIYRAAAGEARMQCTFAIARGSRPLNLAVDGQRVIFGEYGYFGSSDEVIIYVSDDGGRHFEVGYRFQAGSIRHVHGVQPDPYTGNYWVLTGDYDEHPGIGVLSNDLRSFDWLARGSQICRVVQMFIEPDCLIYGTDTDIGQNYIVRMDKSSGKLTQLLPLEGSSLYATSFGPVKVISTTVERNQVTPSRQCSLYASHNGGDWHRGAIHIKDCFHKALFQFGTLVLPYCHHNEPWGIFSGQAVQGAHNRVSMVTFS